MIFKLDLKEKMHSEFTADSKLKSSTLFQKKFDDIENRSFVVGNRSVARRPLKSFQNISGIPEFLDSGLWVGP